MENLVRLVLVNFFLACFFSVLHLPTAFDISILAFPLALLFTLLTGYLSYSRLIKRNEAGLLPTIIRIFQYEPFVLIAAFVLRRSGKAGMPFIIDLLTCLVWLGLTGLSFAILHCLGGKK
ncbi:MAG: hypothetical protein IJL80_14870, partial [Treponema sp.]|nr:hypothetical protein [Treponema sp.]